MPRLLRAIAVVAVLLAGACEKPGGDAAALDSGTAVTRGTPGAAVSTLALPADLTVHSVTPRDSEPEVRRALGTPDSMKAFEDSALGYTSELYYRFGKAVVADGRLHSLHCWGAECKSQQGIGVGSSLDDITARFGPGDLRGEAEHRQLRYEIPGRGCSLVFGFDARGVANGMNLLCRKE